MARTTLRSLPLGIGLLGVLTLMFAPAATPAATPTGCNAIASVTYLGPGTHGTSGAPELSVVGASVIGGPFAFRVSGGPSNATGVLVCSPRGQERFLPAYGATFYPKNLRILEPFTLDANGVSQALLTQPALSAGACGSTWVCQAVVDDWAAPGGRSFTQGLRLRFGRSDGEAGTQLQFTVGVTGGPGVSDLAVGDLDADGISDLVTCQFSGSMRHVYLGMGDGTYAAPLITDVGFNWSRHLQIPDLNADGIPDIVVVQGLSTNFGSVRTFVGLGGGQFSNYASRSIGPDPRGLTVDDLDGDGSPDAVVSTWGHGLNPGELTVFYGSGFGSFGQRLTLDYDYRTGAIIEDMNGDGIKDIVSISDLSGDENTHLGFGVRGFAGLFPDNSPLIGNVSQIASGDFNGDGIADLVEAGYVGPGAAGMLVKLGVGDGTYLDGQLMPVDPINAIEAADLSGDGVLDLAVGDTSTYPAGGFSVFLGKGDGTFADAQRVYDGAGAGGVLVTDIDGDGDLDLAGVTSGGFITLLQD